MRSRPTVLVFALALAAFAPPLAHAQGGPPAAAVQVSAAQQRSLTESVTVTGTVQSRSGADLAAPVGARLLWVAEPGTRVKRGAVVAEFDVEALELSAREQQARIARGEVALRAAEREVQRLKDAGNAVPRVQLSGAEDQRDLAASDLSIARAALAAQRERLGKAVLRANADGVIAQRLKRAGEEVNRGEGVLRLESPTDLELRLFLPLRYVQQVSEGSIVEVEAQGQRGKFAVRRVVPAGNARTQSFDVYVDLTGHQLPIAAGDAVTARLPLGQGRTALMVPRDAVLIRRDGSYVMRLGQNGAKGSTAQKVVVRVTGATGAEVAVEGALAANDQVIIRGAETLQDGDAVRVVRL